MWYNRKKGGDYVNNVCIDRRGHTLKVPVGTRLRYMFSGYKTQMFLRSLRKKAPIYILATIGLLTVVYSLLHPADKIKLRYWITRNCTIETVSKNTPYNSSLTHGNLSGSYETSSKILMDGDWIKSGDKYYQLDGGEVYCYSKDTLGKWQREPSDIDIVSSIMNRKLLDKKNYVRDKKNPFVWNFKEEAYDDTIHMTNVQIKRVYGSIAIVGETTRNGYSAEVTRSYRSFGTTHIELPWEE